MTGRERNVIHLIRGGHLPDCSDQDHTAFRDMRIAAETEGLTFMALAACFLSRDEARILGILAMLQRQLTRYEFDSGEALRAALIRCSDSLSQAQLHLDWRNLARIREAGATHAPLTPRPIWENHQNPAQNMPFSPPPTSSLQARVLHFLTNRAVSGTILQDYGLTKPFVRLMVKRGLLVRDRTGAYLASPEAAAWLARTSAAREAPLPLS